VTATPSTVRFARICGRLNPGERGAQREVGGTGYTANRRPAIVFEVTL
jgi:hypothetical protein